MDSVDDEIKKDERQDYDSQGDVEAKKDPSVGFKKEAPQRGQDGESEGNQMHNIRRSDGKAGGA